MGVISTRAFRSGNSVAVRLPKELGFQAGDELTIHGGRGSIVITRKPTMTTREMIEALRKLPRPDTIEERVPIEFPERPGL
jgi:antitoxin VapB